MAYCETTRRERAGVEKGERERARLQINYPRRSLRRYNKIISGRLYRDSGCERRGRHKVAACAPTAAVINNERRSGGGLHKHGAPSCHFFASSHHLSKLSSSSSLLLLLLLLLYPRLDLERKIRAPRHFSYPRVEGEYLLSLVFRFEKRYIHIANLKVNTVVLENSSVKRGVRGKVAG